MSASPLSCCKGFLDLGTPQGTVTKYANQICYISKPKKESKRAIVIGTDIFGFRLTNVQLLADQFAAQGYLTIVPDLFNDKAFSASALDPIIGLGLNESVSVFAYCHNIFLKFWALLTFLPFVPYFFLKNPPESKILKFVKIFEELRRNRYSIGYQGYCYGGMISMMLSTTNLVDAVSAAHPGKFDISVFKSEFKTNTLLLLVKEDIHIREKQQAELLAFAKTRKDFIVELFAFHHGFAVRGDTRKDDVRMAKEKAFNLALEHFNKHVN
eukprot:NODE_538_length_6985_cov_0.287892.p3 type:complete len:269 gc:universal NODE_538_length_6985_cov_0.287892:3319-4125(+)